MKSLLDDEQRHDVRIKVAKFFTVVKQITDDVRAIAAPFVE